MILDELKKGYIFCNGPLDRYRGGVIGYTTRLKDGLANIGNTNIHILNYVNHRDYHTTKAPVSQQLFIYKIIYFFVLLVNLFKHKDRKTLVPMLLNKYEILGKELIAKIDIKNCQFIHVQGPYNFYQVYNFRKKYALSFKILYTPHDPIPLPYIYDYNGFLYRYGRYIKQAFSILLKRELFASKYADIMVLPCEESLDGYYDKMPKLRTIVYKKTKYIMSGSYAPSIDPNYNLKKLYNIPQDAFICCFIGNNLPIKGIDVIIKAAEEIFKKHDDIYFIIAGSSPNVPSNNVKWITLGHTKKIFEVLNSSDVLLNACTDAYMDLVNIEALAMGIPIIASNRGGHRWLQERTSGVILFENKNDIDLIEKIISLKHMKASEAIDKMRHDNINLYTKYMTVEKFAQNYVNMIHKL